MTQFENLNSMNIDKFAAWIDEYGSVDDAPWMEWFNELYCSNCEDIVCRYPDSAYEFRCAWCEVNNGKCRFFPEMNKIPDGKEIAKMWLESEM